MKTKLQKKKLTGAINESFIYNTEFVCLISQINPCLVNEYILTSNKISKNILKNSINLSRLFPQGLQKQTAFKCFENEKEYISFIYEKNPKNICLTFIKYKQYFINFSENDFSTWTIGAEKSQKRVLNITKSPTLAILISNLSKDLTKNIKLV